MSETPAPSAVLFDLDGTLVDTVGTRARAWMEVFDALGIGYDEAHIGSLLGAEAPAGGNVTVEVRHRSYLSCPPGGLLGRRAGKRSRA